MSRSVFPDGYSEYFSEWEGRIGAFLEHRTAGLTVEASCPATSEPAIAGLPFAVKDNLAVKDWGLTCGSKLLEKFRCPYTATAVARLEAAGAVVMGKTNMDEFGMGSSTDNSALKLTNNPWDTTRVSGGSSGGSAAAVAAGLVPFALGSDTGGSVREPAAFCGVVGLKPTYGAVSRFGLTAYASSLEVVGILSDSVSRARDVFKVIRGQDELDQTTSSAPADSPSLEPLSGRSLGSKTIAFLADTSALEKEVAASYEETKKRLTALGHTLVPCTLPSLKYAVPAYYTIATAEASANLARFDTIRYGQRAPSAENPGDMVEKGRGQGFGKEVKLRILLGTFVLRSGFQDQYYHRAQKIRTGIRRDFDRVLEKADAILMPVFPVRAFPHGDAGLDPFQQKTADVFTCSANLAGLPALSFPATVEGGLPVGHQLVGRAFAEGTLLDIADSYVSSHPIARPAGFRSFWG